MDDNQRNNDDMHEADWDYDSEMMAASVLIVVNNNVAIMNMMMLSWLQDRMRMINNVMMPNQDYRRQPRQSKALLRHNDAVWCIQRDFLGIPGDLATPISKTAVLICSSNCCGPGIREFSIMSCMPIFPSMLLK